MGIEHSSTLKIHMPEARRLIVEYKESTTPPGKKQYVIFGLEKFCASINKIWKHIREDDPYAEMVLIEVERRIANAFDSLNRRHNKIEALLSDELPGISLDIYESRTPMIVPLNSRLFSTTHAKLGARLIGLYDLLCRKLRTYKEFGIINRAGYENHTYNSATPLRGVFSAPLLYKWIGVTRRDIAKQTERGLEAIERLGPVPGDILARTRCSEHGPTPSKVRNIVLPTEQIGA